MAGFECSKDYGGQAPRWVIRTDVGGKSFLHGIRKDKLGILDVAVWCASLDKARRFQDIGSIAQALAFIPEQFEAYEEDDRFVQNI